MLGVPIKAELVQRRRLIYSVQQWKRAVGDTTTQKNTISWPFGQIMVFF